MRWTELWPKAKEVLGKYQYVLLLLLVGALLLALPTGGGKSDSGAEDRTPEGEDISIAWTDLDQRLEDALSQIEGAGKVRVILTVKEGPRQVLAQEGKVGENSHETTTVLASQSGGTREPVKIQELGPSYQGALVVAQGADDPRVRLDLTQAVSALTGLGADKITICKGK